MYPEPIAPHGYGYCECGCGQKTTVSKVTNNRAGHVKGEPLRFARGHNGTRVNVPRTMNRHTPWGDPAECWEWTGTRLPTGYGKVGRQRAHRVAYELTYGPIPNGMVVCHRCDNPPCVNPRHLFIGTGLDNMFDMVAKGREPKGTFRLSLSDATAIRRRYAEGGIKQSELGAAYGVSQTLISQIIRGTIWRVATHARR